MKRYNFILFVSLISLVLQGFAYAIESNDKHLEQIIELLRNTRGHDKNTSTNITNVRGKCGLGICFEIINNWDNFSENQKQELRELLAPPTRQKSRVIGRFTVFYDTVGADSPALIDSNGNRIPNTVEFYIDSAGKFFNYVWTFEIDTFGYSAPPLQADGTYWIVVHELGAGLYGQAFFGSDNPYDPLPYDPGPPARYRTYIEIDNDFSPFENYFTNGMSALQVTVAHEFHHAIQLGSYGYWGSDVYFYEITSTWMEDVVYNDVNDYYGYLFNVPRKIWTSQFAEPHIRFTSSDKLIQYSRVVWAKFLEKRFSRNIMRETWEAMRQVPSLPALDIALHNNTSSFADAFKEWTVWNFFTGSNSDTVKYYTEGNNYPLIAKRDSIQYLSPQSIIDDSIQAVSSSYHIIGGASPMMACVYNINTSSSYSNVFFHYGYRMSNNNGSKPLSNGIFVTIDVSDPANWSSWEDVPQQISSVIAFPNPFIPKSNKPLKFKLPSAVQSTASLYVFSSSLKKIYSNELQVDTHRPFEPTIFWNGHDSNGNEISSGIYFYIITVDDKQYQGKFAVVKE